MADFIKGLKDNPHFLELQRYILDRISELNSIDGLSGKSNEEAGEEVRARAKAIEVLEAILEPFIDFAEKREPTEQEIQNAKNRVGL